MYGGESLITVIAKKQTSAMARPSGPVTVFLRIFIAVTATMAAMAAVTARKAPRTAGEAKKSARKVMPEAMSRMMRNEGQIAPRTAAAAPRKPSIFQPI